MAGEAGRQLPTWLWLCRVSIMLHRCAACTQRQGTFQGADDHILCLPSQSQLFRAVPGFLVQFGINLDRKKNEKWAETIADDPFPIHVGWMSMFVRAGVWARLHSIQLAVIGAGVQCIRGSRAAGQA